MTGDTHTHSYTRMYTYTHARTRATHEAKVKTLVPIAPLIVIFVVACVFRVCTTVAYACVCVGGQMSRTLHMHEKHTYNTHTHKRLYTSKRCTNYWFGGDCFENKHAHTSGRWTCARSRVASVFNRPKRLCLRKCALCRFVLLLTHMQR